MRKSAADIIEFECKILESIVMKVVKNTVLFLCLCGLNYFINFSHWIPIQLGFIIFAIYFLSFLIYVTFANSDLVIDGESLTVRSSIKGIRSTTVSKFDIEEIVFKNDWRDIFMGTKKPSTFRIFFLNFILIFILPMDYKWISIKLKSGKALRYYFFGMSFDEYDNTEEVLFEDMFLELAEQGINVRWNAVSDSYYEGLQEKADRAVMQSEQ